MSSLIKEKIKPNILPISLILVVIIITFWGLGKAGLVDWDEAIYAQVSRNVFNGNPLVLHWGQGEILWFHKPPLYFWITGLFMNIFGVTEFSSRLLSALSGIGLSLVIYLFSRKMFDKNAGVFSLVLVLFNTFLLYSFRFGTLDVFALLLTTLSIYLFWISQSNKKYIIASFIILGLSGLVKGPVIAAPLLIIFLYVLFTGQLTAYLKSKYLWFGLIWMLLIFLPWHIYMYLKFNPDFYNQYVLYHIVKRSKEAIEGHAGGLFFYPHILLRNFPYIILIPSLFFLGRKILKSKQKELLLLFIWLIIQYISIDRVATKLNWYILPVFIPSTMILAFTLSEIYKKKIAYKVIIYLIIIFGTGFSLVKPYFAWKDLSGQEDDKACFKKYTQIIQSNYVTNGYEAPKAYFYLNTSNYNEIKNKNYTPQADETVLVDKKNGIVLSNSQDIIFENKTCKIIKIN